MVTLLVTLYDPWPPQTTPNFSFSTAFYHAMLCIHSTSHGPVYHYFWACPSVTSQSSTKTAKHRITQTTPHDSPGTLVFWSQRSPRNSTGVTPYTGAPDAGGMGQNRRLTTNNRLSKTVQDRRMVSIKVEQEVVCALLNGDIADDLEWPISAPNYPNLYILHHICW